MTGNGLDPAMRFIDRPYLVIRRTEAGEEIVGHYKSLRMAQAHCFEPEDRIEHSSYVLNGR